MVLEEVIETSHLSHIRRAPSHLAILGCLERVRWLEHLSSVWKTEAQPLDHTRILFTTFTDTLYRSASYTFARFPTSLTFPVERFRHFHRVTVKRVATTHILGKSTVQTNPSRLSLLFHNAYYFSQILADKGRIKRPHPEYKTGVLSLYYMSIYWREHDESDAGRWGWSSA